MHASLARLLSAEECTPGAHLLIKDRENKWPWRRADAPDALRVHDKWPPCQDAGALLFDYFKLTDRPVKIHICESLLVQGGPEIVCTAQEPFWVRTSSRAIESS
uniref:SH3 domain-containing protein n=1 Tax=Steinernema glaseri TaxID=37863 RepID=A0A1I7YLU6_9BILA